jgi:hypothetical protein
MVVRWGTSLNASTVSSTVCAYVVAQKQRKGINDKDHFLLLVVNEVDQCSAPSLLPTDNPIIVSRFHRN